MYIGIGISINNRSCFINWLSNYLRWSTALTFSLTISLTFSLIWSKTLSLLSPVTTKRLKTNLSCVAFLFTFLFPFFFLHLLYLFLVQCPVLKKNFFFSFRFKIVCPYYLFFFILLLKKFISDRRIEEKAWRVNRVTRKEFFGFSHQVFSSQYLNGPKSDIFNPQIGF